MKPSKIGGKDTPKRLGMEWAELDESLKKTLR